MLGMLTVATDHKILLHASCGPIAKPFWLEKPSMLLMMVYKEKRKIKSEIGAMWLLTVSSFSVLLLYWVFLVIIAWVMLVWNLLLLLIHLLVSFLLTCFLIFLWSCIDIYISWWLIVFTLIDGWKNLQKWARSRNLHSFRSLWHSRRWQVRVMFSLTCFV